MRTLKTHSFLPIADRGHSPVHVASLASCYLAATGELSLKERVTAIGRLWTRWLRGTSTEDRVAFGPHVLAFEALHYPDWRVYRSIFVECEYGADYTDAVVVDIGAHRGLFAAFALHKECAALFAYEPEPTNYSFLQHNAARFTRPWQQSHVHPQAIGPEDGTVTFYTYDESWSHSIQKRADKVPSGEIEVEQTSFADAISQAAAAAKENQPVIVKLDAEGIEYDVLLNAGSETLAFISKLFVEVHDYADGVLQELKQHLAAHGLHVSNLRQSPGDKHTVLHFRRTLPADAAS